MRAGWTDNRVTAGTGTLGGARATAFPRQARAGVPRLARRAVVGAILTAVSLVFVGAVVSAVMVGWSPAWWRGIDPSEPAMVAGGADIENTVAAELSRVRPGAPTSPAAGSREWRSDEWTVEVTTDEANAWLNTRLRKWLANRGAALPEQVRRFEVTFGSGEMRLGVGLAAGNTVRVVSATMSPVISADGGLWVHATRLYAGRLRLPASWIAGGRSPEWLSGELRNAPGFGATLRALAGEVPLAAPPLAALGDGRAVRVAGIEVRPGRLLVTCRTEAAP